MLVGTDANGKSVLLDRAIYVEDATGGFWTLKSGAAVRDAGTPSSPARPWSRCGEVGRFSCTGCGVDIGSCFVGQLLQGLDALHGR